MKGKLIAVSESVKLPSGVSVPKISSQEAERRQFVSQTLLNMMHLAPQADPVAYSVNAEGHEEYYYDPNRVTEVSPELWYRPAMEARETRTLEDGVVVEKMSVRQAASRGFFTKERLDQMNYDVVTDPVAFSQRPDGRMILFYDKRTALRRPLLCTMCGKEVRYKRKLCRTCFERDLAARRAEGDAYRAQPRHMDRRRVLFFDLELTGVYDHDEIISISIMDATGEVLMDTLVKPLHKKKWNRTEKIHGISPAMVQNAPTLDELVPALKDMFEKADNLIAFGVSTDYGHIKYIYETEEEQEALHRKVRCASQEFVRYQNEHFPDNNHASLLDAMATMGITWDGIPHSSIADTIGCMKVWEALFPNYYTTPAPEAVAHGMTGIPYELEGKNKLEKAAHMAAKMSAVMAADEDAGAPADESAALDVEFSRELMPEDKDMTDAPAHAMANATADATPDSTATDEEVPACV